MRCQVLLLLAQHEEICSATSPPTVCEMLAF
jgi:hypothetical protein